MKTLYQERRNRSKIKFFDASTNRGRFQAVGNRIKELFDEIGEPITCTEDNDVIRRKLKQAFNFTSKKQEQDASGQDSKDGQRV